MPLQHGWIFQNIAYSTAMAEAENQSDFELTKDTPYLALTGSCGVPVMKIMGNIYIIMASHCANKSKLCTCINKTCAYCMGYTVSIEYFIGDHFQCREDLVGGKYIFLLTAKILWEFSLWEGKHISTQWKFTHQIYSLNSYFSDNSKSLTHWPQQSMVHFKNIIFQ